MLASLVLALGAAASVSAHYTLPKVFTSGAGADWQYVRRADNWQNNGFVGSVTSEQIRCFQSSHAGAPNTLTVAAGSGLTYGFAPNLYHPGPLAFYMARVPDEENINSWKGEGAVWFKIYHEKPVATQQSLTWPNMGKSSFSVTIPRCIKAGNYLLRAEHIGLHAASSPGGAQFYISCAQLAVTGGGSTEPANKVAFPGAYQASDPGIQININWPIPQNYKNPGPDVFTC